MVILHSLVPRGLRNSVLLLFSLLFYFWGEGYFVLALASSILFNFFAANLLDNISLERNLLRRTILSLGVLANLLLLLVYKYLGFLSANVASLSELLGGPLLPHIELALPIGISFFTFQALSYLIDVYRREVPAEKNLFSLALYISLFPQLIAGPIVRYTHVAAELRERKLRLSSFVQGACRFIEGLAKKVLIADPLASVADTVFALPPNQLHFSLAWLAALAYTFQIYFDFSGYSDMAIGLGRMFGFRFPENFNYPYISRSVREFWRRWHISLSTWFRDYLYIPLGGNRGNAWQTTRNLSLVFFLCGLWHGASWNFILWGALHGIALSTERVLEPRKKDLELPRVRVLFVFFFLVLSWVIFRLETLAEAGHFYSVMFYPSLIAEQVLETADYLTTKTLIVLFLAIFFSFRPILPYLSRQEAEVPETSEFSFWNFGYLAILFLCATEIIAGSYSPFIYFRF